MGTFPSYPSIIANDALELTPAPPEFQQSFADTVGDAGTNTDGFDLILLQVINAVNQFDNIHAGLDFYMQDLASGAGDLNTPWEQDFADTLVNTITQGQPDFNQFNVDLTGNTPPAPPPPPNTGPTPTPPKPVPPTGGDIGPTSPCDECIDFSAAVAGGQPVDYALGFQNQTNRIVRVTSITLQQGVPEVFSVKANLPGVIPVAGFYPFSVTVTPLQSNTFHALLSIVSDESTMPVVACITVPVSPAGTAVAPPTAQLCGGAGVPPGGGKIRIE